MRLLGLQLHELGEGCVGELSNVIVQLEQGSSDLLIQLGKDGLILLLPAAGGLGKGEGGGGEVRLL
jgi:hypothetical protein